MCGDERADRMMLPGSSCLMNSIGSTSRAVESLSKFRMFGSLRPDSQLLTVTPSRCWPPRQRATSAGLSRSRIKMSRSRRANGWVMGFHRMVRHVLASHGLEARADLTAQNRRHATEMVDLAWGWAHVKRLARWVKIADTATTSTVVRSAGLNRSRIRIECRRWVEGFQHH